MRYLLSLFAVLFVLVATHAYADSEPTDREKWDEFDKWADKKEKGKKKKNKK